MLTSSLIISVLLFLAEADVSMATQNNKNTLNKFFWDYNKELVVENELEFFQNIHQAADHKALSPALVYKPNGNIDLTFDPNNNTVESIDDITPEMLSPNVLIRISDSDSYLKSFEAFNTAGDDDDFDTIRPNGPGIKFDNSLLEQVGKYDYYEIKVGKVREKSVAEPAIPLSGCLSSLKSSSGGTITLTKGITLGLSYSASVSSAINFLPLTPTYSGTSGISTSWDVNIAYLCNVPANKRGQIIARPLSVVVEDVQIRGVNFKKGFFNKNKLTVDTSDYIDVGDIKGYKNSGSLALICVTDEKYLLCD